MENQHRQITGYRELSQSEIALMNEVKQEGERLRALLDRLRKEDAIDKRWISISETHLQQGMMAAVRAIAKPTTF
ncbi:Acb2/Tad1 domain-containing protein [Lysobacter sp. CA199]|uniref:Acb2/Tad1 domain-containing protein n=1 Tax=Lysobacter sp. CA199 TaxID=3455608 RepID=UPI003F8D1B40